MRKINWIDIQKVKLFFSSSFFLSFGFACGIFFYSLLSANGISLEDHLSQFNLEWHCTKIASETFPGYPNVFSIYILNVHGVFSHS